MHYVCTHDVQLYSQAGYGKDAYKAQVAANVQLKAAGEPHPKIWLPDDNNQDFYLLDMPGDDKYDIERGTGVCTDVHYDYMHTGCSSVEGARATQAIAACPFKAMPGRSFLCGILIDVDEDYVHDVGISAISLIYPRVLVEEAQVNGITQQRITCWNPLDCEDTCNHMARTAHSGGLPSPPACALCDMPCPNNAAETIFTAVRALGDDIITAIRLAALCLNPMACVCQARHARVARRLPNALASPTAPNDNCAGVHAAAPRVDRQPAQRAAGVLGARHHEDDPRQGGRGAAHPHRYHRQRRLHRPHQRAPQAHQEDRDRGEL